MKEYLDALEYIMNNGVDRPDRTGVGTRSVFSYQMRFNLKDGFPAMTTKRLAWKAIKSELLWFLEGSGDERRLAEILYGDKRANLKDKKTIWTENANADYWTERSEYEGDLGRVYGVQWRSWNSPDYTSFGNEWGIIISQVDQIKTLISRLKSNPYDRRHIVSAWNPGELHLMALPPCHMIFQFYVAPNANGKDEISCHMNQRSADLFLGIPFNIASYALLTHMIAQVCDFEVGELVITLGDAHIYHNHYDQVMEQLRREPGPLPKLWLNPNKKDILKFSMDDIELIGYNPQETIKAKMAV